jgi:hypothetical protein
MVDSAPMKSAGSLLASLALGVFAVYLAVSISAAAFTTGKTGVVMVAHWGETPLEERSRSFSREYSEGIAAIRKTIPADGAYLLVNGTPGEKAGPVWAKFDLAPRRAVFLGDLDQLTDGDRLRSRTPRAARWVVITHGEYGRPVVIERSKFVRSLRERADG